MRRVAFVLLALLLLIQISPSTAAEKTSNSWSVKQKIIYVGLTPAGDPTFWTGAPAVSSEAEPVIGAEQFVKEAVTNTMNFWIKNSAGKMKFAAPKFYFGKPGTALKRCNGSADIKSGMKVAGITKIPVGTHLVVANVNDSCGYAGLGAQGGNTINLKSLSSSTLAHELGHNFGFRHSSAVYCEKSNYSIFNASNCKVDEYGDFRDLMGNDEWCPDATLSAAQRATVFYTPIAKDAKVGVDLNIDESQIKSDNIIYQLKYKNNWYFFEYFNPSSDRCMTVSGIAYEPQLQVRVIGPSWALSSGMAVGPTLIMREYLDLPEGNIKFERNGVPVSIPSDGWTLTGFFTGEKFKLPGAPYVLSVKSTDPTSAVFTISAFS